MAGIGLRNIVLVDPEQGSRGVQAAIPEGTLESRFVALADHGVQITAVTVLGVLRLEYLRVADIGRVDRREVVQGSGVGNDHAAITVVHSAAVGFAALAPVRIANTQHDPEIISQRQACCQIGTALLDIQITVGASLAADGLWIGAIPLVEVDNIGYPLQGIGVNDVIHLSSGKSEGQFVFTSEQFISTCNVQPCAALLATGVGEVRRRTQSQAGHTVWFAIQVQQFQFRVIVGVIEIQGGFPAIGETVDEVQELVFIGGG